MSVDDRQAAVGRSVRKLVLITIGMFGFGFLMVPFYNVFCDITGLNGRGDFQADEAVAHEVDESRWVTVEFVASVNQGLPWEFRPEVTRMKVRPGQAYTAVFHARNQAGRPMVGQAVPSVAPGIAAPYFQKTECFCFSRQPFDAGQAREMPVRFIISPDLPEEIEEVALSYTFFDITGKVAAEAPRGRLESLAPAGHKTNL
ncbi:cytochrome c oxidase assembly protein [Thiohalobacter sp.]|uniref:cytochrome c oxidase assembly protein n=1 Tax=Thiohalobacter sp. TaxID=2025948 RepID=UPI00261B13C2|nr:cytochrome c oxidase assembly protein [Thiohalobacter sp.]